MSTPHKLLRDTRQLLWTKRRGGGEFRATRVGPLLITRRPAHDNERASAVLPRCKTFSLSLTLSHSSSPSVSLTLSLSLSPGVYFFFRAGILLSLLLSTTRHRTSFPTRSRFPVKLPADYGLQCRLPGALRVWFLICYSF